MPDLNNHYYLKAVSISLIVALVLLTVLPTERRSLCSSGILLVPFGFIFAPINEGQYWSVERIFGHRFGVEDALFCFSVGVISRGLAVLLLGPLKPVCIRTGAAIAKCVAIGLTGAAAFIGAYALGVSDIHSLILCQLAATVAIWIAQPRLIGVGIAAGAAFTVYYCAALALSALALGQGFAAIWSDNGIWGPRPMGIPLEEAAWGFSFAMAWVPLLIWASDRGNTSR